MDPVFPNPEIVSNLPEPWTVEQGHNHNYFVATANEERPYNVMSIPLQNEAWAHSIRMHEMGHARWSDFDLALMEKATKEIGDAYIQSVEDCRIQYLLCKAGVDMSADYMPPNARKTLQAAHDRYIKNGNVGELAISLLSSCFTGSYDAVLDFWRSSANSEHHMSTIEDGIAIFTSTVNKLFERSEEPTTHDMIETARYLKGLIEDYYKKRAASKENANGAEGTGGTGNTNLSNGSNGSSGGSGSQTSSPTNSTNSTTTSIPTSVSNSNLHTYIQRVINLAPKMQSAPKPDPTIKNLAEYKATGRVGLEQQTSSNGPIPISYVTELLRSYPPGSSIKQVGTDRFFVVDRTGEPIGAFSSRDYAPYPSYDSTDWGNRVSSWSSMVDSSKNSNAMSYRAMDIASRFRPQYIPWCPMDIIEPRLEKPINIGKVGRKKSSDSSGLVPSAMHRWTTDKQIFGTKKFIPGGSVLIDGSSSLSLTFDQIMGIVSSAPASIIGIYGGDSKTGSLKVLVDSGRRVAESEMKSPGGYNSVDYPALKWLAEQQEPRIWISDGEIHGYGGCISIANVEEVEQLIAKKNIIFLSSYNDAVVYLKKVFRRGYLD